MKHWLGITAASLAFVAIWYLPPESLGNRDPAVESAAEIRFGKVAREYRLTHEVLQRVRWADSLAAFTLANAEDGLAVGIPEASTLSDHLREQFLDKISWEQAALEPRAEDVVVGFFFQPPQHGSQPDSRPSLRLRQETYVGIRDGTSYCMQVQVVNDDLQRMFLNAYWTPLNKPNLLGPCRLYAQYGMAGPQIQDWMESGGAGFAAEKWDGSDPRMGELWRRRRFIFGYNRMSGPGQSIEVDRCLAGIAEACVTLVLEPAFASDREAREREIVLRSPATSIGEWAWTDRIFYDERYMLSDLEAEFGPEAFQRFWTSDADVPEAFEAAFGVDLGTWLVTWIDSVWGVDPPGPRLPFSATFLSLRTVGLLASWAAARVRKIKVA